MNTFLLSELTGFHSIVGKHGFAGLAYTASDNGQIYHAVNFSFTDLIITLSLPEYLIQSGFSKTPPRPRGRYSWGNPGGKPPSITLGAGGGRGFRTLELTKDAI